MGPQPWQPTAAGGCLCHHSGRAGRLRRRGDRQLVGSTYFEPPAGESGAVVLIDPLAPPAGSDEARTFWTALDRDVERAGRPLLILSSNGYHAREAAAFRQRYAGKHGSAIWAPADAIPRLRFEPHRRFGAPAAPHIGVESEKDRISYT